jgi:FkbM family methyltransferase
MLPMLQAYAALLHAVLGNERLTLIDVGAAGDIEPRWKKISPLIHYVGFEPDARSRVSLETKNHSCLSYRVLPYVIWDVNAPIDINLCRDPQKSSYYPPNLPFVSRFSDVERFDILSEETLEARTLDSLEMAGDFLKLDLQGGELAALRGGRTLLDNCFGVELEVEFAQIYGSQPLFGDLCRFFTEHGMEFVDFLSLRRWERTGFNGYGQCVFGDALFMKPPEALFRKGDITPAAIRRFIAVCALYNRFDWIGLTLDLAKGVEGWATEGRCSHAIRELRTRFLRAQKAGHLLGRLARRFGQEYWLHLMY